MAGPIPPSAYAIIAGIAVMSAPDSANGPQKAQVRPYASAKYAQGDENVVLRGCISSFITYLFTRMLSPMVLASAFSVLMAPVMSDVRVRRYPTRSLYSTILDFLSRIGGPDLKCVTFSHFLRYTLCTRELQQLQREARPIYVQPVGHKAGNARPCRGENAFEFFDRKKTSRPSRLCIGATSRRFIDIYIAGWGMWLTAKI